MVDFIMESPDYKETRERLQKDPIVRQMAEDVKASGLPLNEFWHYNEDDYKFTGNIPTVRFSFMQASNAEYRRKAQDDTKLRHLGAVGEAIWLVLHESS